MKRDIETWFLIAMEFIENWQDTKSNYNEDGNIPGSRNSDELILFFRFCVENPDLRFFQALAMWSGYDIYAATPDNMESEFYDTFNWEVQFDKTKYV